MLFAAVTGHIHVPHYKSEEPHIAEEASAGTGYAQQGQSGTGASWAPGSGTGSSAQAPAGASLADAGVASKAADVGAKTMGEPSLTCHTLCPPCQPLRQQLVHPAPHQVVAGADVQGHAWVSEPVCQGPHAAALHLLRCAAVTCCLCGTSRQAWCSSDQFVLAAEGHHDIPEYESEKPFKPAAVGAMSYTGASGASHGDRSPAQTAPPSSTQVSCPGRLCMCLQLLLLQLLHHDPP